MSDPVSSMDVEDVLSSIRRLVSEEAKGSNPESSDAGQGGAGQTGTEQMGGLRAEESQQPDGADARSDPMITDGTMRLRKDAPEDGRDTTGGAASPAFSTPETGMSFRHQAAAAARRGEEQKLVLTAALRVASPDPADIPTRPHTGSEANRPQRPHLRPVEPLPVADPTPELRAEPVAEPTEQTTPAPRVVISEPAPDLRAEPNPMSDAPALSGTVTQESVQDTAAEPKPAFASEPRIDPAPETPVRETPSAPDGVAAATPASEPESEPAPRHPRPFDYAPDDTLFDRAKRAMAEVAPMPSTGPAEAGDGASIDAPFGAAFEPTPDPQSAAPQRSDDVRGPVRSPFGPTSGSINQRPPEPVEPVAEPVISGPGYQSQDEETSTINFAEEEESILDEDTLRDLISQMVREELQGELGDRITRNVRKLVRREIQRAIASREFE